MAMKQATRDAKHHEHTQQALEEHTAPPLIAPPFFLPWLDFLFPTHLPLTCMRVSQADLAKHKTELEEHRDALMESQGKLATEMRQAARDAKHHEHTEQELEHTQQELEDHKAAFISELEQITLKLNKERDLGGASGQIQTQLQKMRVVHYAQIRDMQSQMDSVLRQQQEGGAVEETASPPDPFRPGDNEGWQRLKQHVMALHDRNDVLHDRNNELEDILRLFREDHALVHPAASPGSRAASRGGDPAGDSSNPLHQRYLEQRAEVDDERAPKARPGGRSQAWGGSRSNSWEHYLAHTP